MRVSKKLAASLLVLLLFVSILPAAFATEGEGTDSTTAPVEDNTGSTDPTPSVPDPSEPETTEPETTEPETTEPETTEPETTEPETTEPETTEPETTEPETTAPTQPPYRPQPTEPKVNTDYANLNRQIAIANGLKEREYTQESWKVLAAALETAVNAQKSQKQDVVDSAADALKQAISELVTMNYSELEKALTAARECITPDEYELVIALNAAAEEAELLRSSGDQDAVDACTEKIYDLISRLQASLSETDEPSVVIREVEVEVPPTDDFCNIPMHRTWPLLFFASAALNVALLIVIFSALRRRKRRGEDVPLVNYDIDDDF